MRSLISSQFIAQNIHFGINLFAALACIAACWLYLDAWNERRHPAGIAKFIGFALLACSFLIAGTAWGSVGARDMYSDLFKLLGYLYITLGQFATRIQPRPHTPQIFPAITVTPMSAAISLAGVLPFAALGVSIVYWRLAVVGLERHLKPLALVFGLFAASDALALTTMWQQGDNPVLQSLVMPLGSIWLLSHIMLFLGAALLAHWVWRYLTKRLLSQLFLVFTSLTFAIVLVAAVSITSLLLSGLQKDTLTSLETATKVLRYAIDSKASDTRANAEILAHSPEIVQATATLDHTALSTLSAKFLIQRQLSDDIITSDTGVVLARGSDPEHFGDSLSNDPLIERVQSGSTTSSISGQTGPIAPTLMMTTASAIRAQQTIIGYAIANQALDNAFVDGIKHNTGLDSAIYVGAIRSATTLTGSDGTSRVIGANEPNQDVVNKTLKQGQTWRGVTNIGGQSYLGVYLPLKDVSNVVVGMLFVGQPQDAILKSAGQAINVTLLTSVFWLVVMVLPLYLLARSIARQLG